jgi:hypothetical protein
MPLEIRELVIKAVVGDRPPGKKEVNGSVNKHELRRMKDEILKECMRRVNDILEKQTER